MLLGADGLVVQARMAALEQELATAQAQLAAAAGRGESDELLRVKQVGAMGEGACAGRWGNVGWWRAV